MVAKRLDYFAFIIAEKLGGHAQRYWLPDIRLSKTELPGGNFWNEIPLNRPETSGSNLRVSSLSSSSTYNTLQGCIAVPFLINAANDQQSFFPPYSPIRRKFV